MDGDSDGISSDEFDSTDENNDNSDDDDHYVVPDSPIVLPPQETKNGKRKVGFFSNIFSSSKLILTEDKLTGGK